MYSFSGIKNVNSKQGEADPLTQPIVHAFEHETDTHFVKNTHRLTRTVSVVHANEC